MFEIRTFTNSTQGPTVRATAQQGEVVAAPEAPAQPPALKNDKVALSKEAEYPTVGEYVKDQFDQKMGSVLTGLHLVAETMPPVLIAEIASIHASHKKAALEKIWNLPMDPQGKWKVKAQQIMDAEAALARKEVSQLPLVKAVGNAGRAVADGATWVGNQITAGFKNASGGIRKAFQSLGRLINHGANYVLDGFVSTGVAIGKGVQQAGVAIENGSRAAGQAVRNASVVLAKGVNDAYDTTVKGVTWLGHQAVEVPKAAARGVLGGIGEVGQDMVDFSKRAEPVFAPAN